MSKNSFFIGQPVFSQILRLLPKAKINSIAIDTEADKYCKRFSTYDHLVTMMYGVLNQCNSLREITTGFLALEDKIAHLGIKYPPRRSTIADAGRRRNAEVFEQIYKALLKRHGDLLSDSRLKKESRLYIFDSSTISLFQEVLKAAGKSKVDGRRKGGIKVHTLMRSDQDVAQMVTFSSSASNDSTFLKQVELPSGSIIVFDKGYNSYSNYNRFNQMKVSWVTRLNVKAKYRYIKSRHVSKKHKQLGVIKDHLVELGHTHRHSAVKVIARIITYKDEDTGRTFEFITNNLRFSPVTVAALYRKRWQIELLFKRLKQNYTLQYFLGDTENAIQIQIWCCLIVDLLLKIINKLGNGKWSFSNLVTMCRLLLMTYINIIKFMRASETDLASRFTRQQSKMPSLFPT